ncbi:MAG: hypothetical protein HYZ38_05715 [Mycobacterium sp.]|nr:hypothetical protein [Mycobacterium sp.]
MDPNRTQQGTDDTDSDPAKGADDRSDWADEGGATSTGPATDSESR